MSSDGKNIPECIPSSSLPIHAIMSTITAVVNHHKIIPLFNACHGVQYDDD